MSIIANRQSLKSVEPVSAEDFNKAAAKADPYDYDSVAIPEVREGQVPPTEKCLAKPKGKRNSRGADR